MKLRTLLAMSLLVLVFVVGLSATPSQAADHLDAPGLTSPGGDGRLDINDIYAFKSGENTVLVMTVNPAAGIFSPTSFHPDASYDFKIDTDGDAKEDITIKVTFDGDAGVQDMRVRCTPAAQCNVNGMKFDVRGQTGQTIDLGGVAKVRADLFDDPFFFDLNAFLGAYDFCNAPGGPAGNSGADFFAGLNVSAIVLEFPRSMLPTDTIGFWARTRLNGELVDRMGRPAINTVFIPSDFKNAFNEGKPRNDQRDFSQFLGDFAGVLLPDILTVDTSSDAGFLNGRQLANDVIDAELQIITGNPAAGDCVDANDVPFLSEFPYLAPAH